MTGPIDHPVAAPALRWVARVLAVLIPSAALAQTENSAAAGPARLDSRAVLASSAAAVGRIPGAYLMRDRQGREVRLADYRGRPLLVNFIYTACFEICPNSTLALAKAVNAMRQRFGSSQFNVVSIGFDQPTDSPAALRDYAKQRRISDPNWEFLSPRREDVPALARDFGFSYVATPGGFDHTLQVSIVDAEGRIRRQVVGDTFSADMLGEPLKQLIGGLPVGDTLRLTDIFDRVRILCSVYDPATGEYRVSYALYFEIAGGITFILGMIWFAINEWLLVRAARRLQPP